MPTREKILCECGYSCFKWLIRQHKRSKPHLLNMEKLKQEPEASLKKGTT